MFVEISIEPTYAKLPVPGQAQIRIYNGIECTYDISSPAFTTSLPPNGFVENLEREIKGESESVRFSLTSKTAGCNAIDKTVLVEEDKASSFFIRGSPAAPELFFFHDDPDKSSKGFAVLRILANPMVSKVDLIDEGGVKEFSNETINESNFEIPPGKYELKIDGVSIFKDQEFKIGGVYAVVVKDRRANVLIVTQENSVSMLWLIPQYVIMTLGEVMYSVTGLQFSYSEAPESMRSGEM